jgi:hypothetical protein
MGCLMFLRKIAKTLAVHLQTPPPLLLLYWTERSGSRCLEWRVQSKVVDPRGVILRSLSSG